MQHNINDLHVPGNHANANCAVLLSLNTIVVLAKKSLGLEIASMHTSNIFAPTVGPSSALALGTPGVIW